MALYGYYYGLRAIILHTFGVWVGLVIKELQRLASGVVWLKVFGVGVKLFFAGRRGSHTGSGTEMHRCRV